MKTVCNIDMCNGCKACVFKCTKKAIQVDEGLKAFNAIINEDLCVGCNACKQVCPVNNHPALFSQIDCFEGWSNNAELRAKSSSGGLASEISDKFVEGGGIVCSCTFKNENFTFDLADNKLDLNAFTGSKYIKSNPDDIYQKIVIELQNNKVLFIGLPCQVAGALNFVPSLLHKNFYTVDLICHGTPSLKCLEKYLNSQKICKNDIKKISFRNHNNFFVSINNNLSFKNIADCYTLSFLKGLNYTDNCYQCAFATLNRCSDITLGDSWGSSLSYEEKKRGISLILCQTEKGKELLINADVTLKDVNMKVAVANNHQLVSPSKEPKNRQLFFKKLSENKNYNLLLFRFFPISFLKQKTKYILYGFINIIKKVKFTNSRGSI